MTRRCIISYTIMILDDVSRWFINNVYCIRLFSLINVRKCFFEIEFSFDDILIIRCCKDFQRTLYTFAVMIEVENWVFWVDLKS